MIKVGRFNSPHGIKGFIKIQSYLDPLDTIFDKTLNLFLADLTPLIIHKKNSKDSFFIVSIDDVVTRNDAEKYVNQEIFVQEQQLEALLKPNEFYLRDLIGFALYDQSDKYIGEVRQIADFGAGPLLEITLDNNKLEYYPYSPEFIVSLSFEDKKIVTTYKY